MIFLLSDARRITLNMVSKRKPCKFIYMWSQNKVNSYIHISTTTCTVVCTVVTKSGVYSAQVIARCTMYIRPTETAQSHWQTCIQVQYTSNILVNKFLYEMLGEKIPNWSNILAKYYYRGTCYLCLLLCRNINTDSYQTYFSLHSDIAPPAPSFPSVHYSMRF